jgi:hypothetical protein
VSGKHPRAQEYAEAAEAAAAQGRFWEMHDALFAEQDPEPVELAERLGLDVERFGRELRDGTHAAAVAADRAEGEERGVSGTPAFFVAGERHRGFYDVEALIDALEDAAGVPTVVQAVRASAKRDAHAATGWPVTRWVGRFRPDPLRRLGLRSDALRVPDDRPDLARTSLPATRPSVRAAAATAVRRYVEQVTEGAPDAWVLAARRRTQEGIDQLPDALDQAVASTRLEAGRRPFWWRAVNALQWLVLAAVVVGLLWLAAAFVVSYFQLPPLPTPVVTAGEGVWDPVGGASDAAGGVDVPWPTMLVLGGVVLGILLALVSRVFAAIGARRRAARARKRLRESVVQVANQLVRLPVGEELAALARCRAAASIAAS